ncbi:hypothetical protein B0H14DRAFT_2596243 [Mycena olivaceomarginata]|nr:hypothetical protein B0H14DRAFT_2596243 [Mycena olivaceomarginata]
MSIILLACNSPASANIRVATYYLCIVDATSPPPTSWDVDSLTAVIREQARGAPSGSKDTDTSHGPNAYVAARDLDASSGPPAVLQVNRLNRSELFLAASLLAVILNHFGLAFNTRYKIFVCSPGNCGFGLTIDQILGILQSKEIKKGLLKAQYAWKEGDVAHTAHRKISPTQDFERELVSSLIADERSGVKSPDDLPRAAQMADGTEWKETSASWPVPGQVGQVKGVRIVSEAYMCGACRTFCGVTGRAVETHRAASGCGRGQRIAQLKIAAVQTLLSDRMWSRYFQVPTGDAELIAPPSVSPAELLRKSKEDIIGPELHEKLAKEDELRRQSIPSAFIDTGATLFLDCFDREEVRSRAHIPRLDSKLSRYMKRLHTLHVASLENDVELAKGSHPAVITALTEGASMTLLTALRGLGRASRPKPFTIPANLRQYRAR